MNSIASTPTPQHACTQQHCIHVSKAHNMPYLCQECAGSDHGVPGGRLEAVQDLKQALLAKPLG